MSRFLLSLCLLIGIAQSAAAETACSPPALWQQLQASRRPANICLVSENDSKLSHQGCCSHHSGVCGCSNGRALCCDGQLSPSCGCDKRTNQFQGLSISRKGEAT
jgi:hypothetical protein